MTHSVWREYDSTLQGQWRLEAHRGWIHLAKVGRQMRKPSCGSATRGTFRPAAAGNRRAGGLRGRSPCYKTIRQLHGSRSGVGEAGLRQRLQYSRRDVMLKSVLDIIPELYPFVHQPYSTPSV